MTFEIIFVFLALLGMTRLMQHSVALILDKMRPGMVLFSVVVDCWTEKSFAQESLWYLTPVKEMLTSFRMKPAGFSRSIKGMITVAMHSDFLVHSLVAQSGYSPPVRGIGTTYQENCLNPVEPGRKTTVFIGLGNSGPHVADNLTPL